MERMPWNSEVALYAECVQYPHVWGFVAHVLSKTSLTLRKETRLILTWPFPYCTPQIVGDPLPPTDESRRAIEEAFRISGGALFVGRNRNDIMVEVFALFPFMHLW